jgi:hypothetical protein
MMRNVLIATAFAAAVPLHCLAQAASQCPPYNFINSVNLALNPSFERCSGPKSWKAGDPYHAPSAASDWVMSTSNAQDPVFSECVVTTAPGPNGAQMLHFVAGGGEGGVIQFLPSAPAKVMFSAWVYVKSGHVVIQPHGGGGGPSAWSSKLGEWEQLRVCSDGSVATDAYIIVNNDAAGGEFYVDRVEIRQTP